ncbi:transcriptional regulator, TetR family [Ruegeria sp. TM1040]|nr:transcriptional regulator, TetR family [Ruegeria sp. TM1040]
MQLPSVFAVLSRLDCHYRLMSVIECMRTRLSRSARRAEILGNAQKLIAARGFSGTEMEDIRLASGISRGGLYHHFANKHAVLDALVAEEVRRLADQLKAAQGSPIPALLRVGSSDLGNDPGLVSHLHTPEEKRAYLSSLEQAIPAELGPVLHERLRGHTAEGAAPAHVAELFLTITAHINRRRILNEWPPEEAAGFTATALRALLPLLTSQAELQPVIAELKRVAATS